ncbi:putative effector protein/Endo-polygalacturonase [Ceratobasidium theobromae]|uniref:endo-polygalacturonase n=1 Tax=Ceratobasidium theobromae TaxID=1582974 RepID=A0A5N5QFE9_9AGAM|nr:putative effector protein/Endo-polygalacturonase [Ceratobasidium theobromae]
MRLALAVVALPAILSSAAPAKPGNICTGTISSLDDVSGAQKCTNININPFTVPAGKTFTLSLLPGTTVNLLGNIKFVNGHGYTFDGQGPAYWDGLGTNGGVTKPHPMMKITMSGNYTNVKVLNSPAHMYSVGNRAPLVMSKLVIDDSAGDAPNSKSDGKPAGHNTDGFDVSANDLVIEDSIIYNQDDCIAINKGSNIIFRRNTCINGHAISIGSISSNAQVNNVQIQNNKVVNNVHALRIKTKSDAANASVRNIVFSGNTATGIQKFGVLVDQSYPSTLGTPGNNVEISGIFFKNNTISVAPNAQRVAVNCGAGCTGIWNLSGLKVLGGKSGKVLNYKNINAGSY